jgi:hypothetical protein
MDQIYLFSWAYTRNFLAIASGATPIGSAIVHPIERSRQKVWKEVEAGDKRKVDESKVYV